MVFSYTGSKPDKTFPGPPRVFLRLLAIALAVCGLTSCSLEKADTLAGRWEVASGFQPDKKDPFSNLHFQRLDLPARLSRDAGISAFEYRGWILLRRELPADLADAALHDSLALHIGSISDVAIIYLDDQVVGRLGQEKPYHPGFRHFTAALPWNRPQAPKTLSIAMLATDYFPANLTSMEIRAGMPQDVFAHVTHVEIISTLFVALYLSIGAYHLLLAVRRIQDLYNLYFSVLALLLAGFFAFQMYTFEDLAGDHVLLRERLAQTCLFLLGPPLLFFLSDYFYGTLSRLGVLALILFSIMTAAVWVSDYRQLRGLRDVWHLMAVAVMVYVVFYIARECLLKKIDALYMAPGIAVLMITGIHDILVARGVIYSIPNTSKISFLILNAGLAVILANRVIRLQKRVTELNQNLEERVRLRTTELAAALYDLQIKDKRIQNEMELAREIQLGILPSMPLDWNGFRIAARYQSMRKIGGDFYDVQQTPDGRLAVLMADVSGHGIPASLITTMTKISFTTAIQKHTGPAAILAAIHEELLTHISSYHYLTAALLLISPDGTAIYASGGHCPAVVMRETEVTRLAPAGSVLGAIRSAPITIEEARISLTEGDRLLLYTDGITEARQQREQFGIDRLCEVCRMHAHLGADEMLDVVLSSVTTFAGKPDPDDDISLLLLERPGRRNQ